MKIKNILSNKIVKIIILILATILLLYNIIFVVQVLITNKEYIDLFGISISITNDNTMKGSVSKNSLVISKKCDFEKVNEKDLISVKSNDNLKLRRVSKKVGDEKIQFVVKGDNNYFNDTQYVSKDDFYGKVICSIPFVGILFKIFQSKIITIIILFLTIYILYNTKQAKKRRQKTRKIRKEIKREQE